MVIAECCECGSARFAFAGNSSTATMWMGVNFVTFKSEVHFDVGITRIG